MRVYYELPDSVVTTVFEMSNCDGLAFDQALIQLLSEFVSYVEATVTFKDQISEAASCLVPGSERTSCPDPADEFTSVPLCERCMRGEGGECHTPGCALWMNRAPDIPVAAFLPTVAGPS